jgi:hypothetical protein
MSWSLKVAPIGGCPYEFNDRIVTSLSVSVLRLSNRLRASRDSIDQLYVSIEFVVHSAVH